MYVPNLLALNSQELEKLKPRFASSCEYLILVLEMEGRSNGSLRELVVLVVATKGPLQNLSPLPSTLSLLSSFSVSPLPKSNMAHKQMFHRIYEDRQLRRLLKVFARVNWAFESQSSLCWVFFSLLLRSCRLHS